MIDSSHPIPTWLESLRRDGIVVVPNVIPQSACEVFQKEALNWLEGFPYGFKRDDKTTWDAHHLPYGFTGGLYNRYAVNHEAFVWAIRSQPGIKKLYETIYGTGDLVVSFDGINVSLPVGGNGRKDIEPTKAWPHIDQDRTEISDCQIFQGIASLSEIGDNDGGLVVMKGSHNIHSAFPFKEERAKPGGYSYTMADLRWYKDRGCEGLKVNSRKGDFIIWDSRTIHWNASPTGERTRFATYVCMAPLSTMSETDLVRKLDIFRHTKGTDGYPNRNNVPEDAGRDDSKPRRPDGSVDQANRSRPIKAPEETRSILDLVGVRG